MNLLLTPKHMPSSNLLMDSHFTPINSTQLIKTKKQLLSSIYHKQHHHILLNQSNHKKKPEETKSKQTVCYKILNKCSLMDMIIIYVIRINQQNENNVFHNNPKLYLQNIKQSIMTNTHLTNKLNHISNQSEPLFSKQQYQQLIAQWKQKQKESLMLTHFDTQNIDPQEEEEHAPIIINLSQKRENTLKKRSKEVVQYLNAKYIMEDLIEPIELYQLIDLKSIKNVEFIYMICFRAWCEISQSLSKFFIEQNETILSKMEQSVNNFDETEKSLFDCIVKLYMKIDRYVKNYHEILLEKESCIVSQSKNILRSIFNHQRKTDRNKFLFGYEGVEFSRPEQINYLYNFYLKNVICEIKKKGKKFETFLLKLQIYKKLLTSRINHLQGFDDYEIFKQKLMQKFILHQKEKI